MTIALFLVGRCWKQCFWHHSEREGAGNTVSGITPNGKVLETLFLALLQSGRRWKRCFWHYSERKGAGNNVSDITPNGKVLETLFPASLQPGRCRKQCFCVLSKGSGKGNNVVVTKRSVLTTKAHYFMSSPSAGNSAKPFISCRILSRRVNI